MPEKPPEKPAEEQIPDSQKDEAAPVIPLSLGDADFTPEFQQLASEDPETGEALREKAEKAQREIEEEKDRATMEHYESLKDEFNITLQNPLAGVNPNSVLTYSIGEVIGYSFAEIKSAYPDIDDNLVKRAAIMAAVGALAFGTKLITHEYGHARAMREAGGESRVVFFPDGIFGAKTFCLKYPDLMSVADTIAHTTAGLNQEEKAAKYGRIQDLRTRKGRTMDPLAELPHAASQLINKFAVSSYVLLAGRKEGFANDVDDYLAGAKLDVDRGSVLVNSLLMSALSGSVIDNARRTVGYLANPDEEVDELSLKLGEVELFLPEFSYYLTPGGAYRTAALLANVGENLVRLEGGVGGVGHSLELQVYDFKLGENVSVSPYIAVSKREKGKNEVYRAETNKERPGGRVGTEFEVKLTDNATLTGEGGYAHHDVMTQYVVPTGPKAIMEGMGGSGFYGWMGITIKE